MVFDPTARRREILLHRRAERERTAKRAFLYGAILCITGALLGVGLFCVDDWSVLPMVAVILLVGGGWFMIWLGKRVRARNNEVPDVLPEARVYEDTTNSETLL